MPLVVHTCITTHWCVSRCEKINPIRKIRRKIYECFVLIISSSLFIKGIARLAIFTMIIIINGTL